jgi:hypothetical protein
VGDLLNEAIRTAPDSAEAQRRLKLRDDLDGQLKPGGKLKAWGCSDRSRARKPVAIPAEEWSTIDTLHDFGTAVSAHDVGVRGEVGATTFYREVFAYRSDVLAIWPVLAERDLSCPHPAPAVAETVVPRHPLAPRPFIWSGKKKSAPQVRRISLAEIYDALTFDALNGMSDKKRFSEVAAYAKKHGNKPIPQSRLERKIFSEWRRMVTGQPG